MLAIMFPHLYEEDIDVAETMEGDVVQMLLTNSVGNANQPWGDAQAAPSGSGI